MKTKKLLKLINRVKREAGTNSGKFWLDRIASEITCVSDYSGRLAKKEFYKTLERHLDSDFYLNQVVYQDVCISVAKLIVEITKL